MSTTNTYHNGPSVSLPAGTWLVRFSSIPSGARPHRAKLWDGATDYAMSESRKGIVEVSVVLIASGTQTFTVVSNGTSSKLISIRLA